MSRPLLVTALALAAASAVFLTLGARGDWSFVLAFRGEKLAALIVVGSAVAASTVAFQTVTGNRILTPAIMGFDALYVLIQTLLVFGLGGVGLAALDARVLFGAETALMLGAALLLFAWLLRRGADLNRLVLTGIIFGTLFRSLSGLLNRLIDPADFAVVQSASFARFNSVDDRLLWPAAAVTVLALAALLARHARLDVVALGRDAATALGVDHDREARRVMVLIAILVSVSTALVGPVVFFGLLVSALTHAVAGTWRHAVLLPLSALLASVVLVAGQTLFERALSLQTSVSVVIEGLGGAVFLILILRRAAR
ncbi:iron chelate uptake ABC transporter family permease subunit [Roseivivax marinus]|uniref:iron chelate uptake ABC transporter family permease subunit n=1 Tax=Roseivivax marinus TaxID=1379903 RepID=UPI001F0374C0|nr:iron chelate uptake ABC transporter family permease subunit [Roseivivax marinus]UMA63612.1 iron chelate uptake ABC transporter family permease subunit [Roseivivax marinus]